MNSSSRGVSERSVTRARGSLPSGWRAGVFGRTGGMTGNPAARSLGTSRLPTAPVAPATRTVITGATVHDLLSPELLPPGWIGRLRRVVAHPLVNAGHVPSGQRGERLGFLTVTDRELLAVGARGGAGGGAAPGMPDDVATLEVLLVAGLLEDQVLREVLRVV